MQSAKMNSDVELSRMRPAADVKAPDIAAAPIADALTALHVDPETGLSRAEATTRQKRHGYNEMLSKKGHPILAFLAKFWGLSAWMLELIMVLSRTAEIFGFRRSSALFVVNAY